MIPLLLLFNDVSKLPDPRSLTPTNPAAVIARGIRVQGGASAVSKLRTVHIQVAGTAPGPSGQPIPVLLEDYWVWPERYRTQDKFEFNGKALDRALVLDRESGWTSLNGKVDTMPPAALKEMREEFYEESVDKLFPLTAAGYKLQSVGVIVVAGHPAFGVKVSSTGHRDVVLLFDRSSGLLVERKDHILDDAGKTVLREVLYSNYREFSGIKMPVRLTAYYDGKVQFSGSVKAIEFPHEMPVALFRRPKEQ